MHKRLPKLLDMLQSTLEEEETEVIEFVRKRLAELVALELLLHALDPDAANFADRISSDFDERIRLAICRLHEDPAKNWTVGALAAAVNMSRSSLAKRFKDGVGEPPMEYLARIRAELAVRLLRSRDLPIVSIANDVGYSSETAFITAFRRIKGVTPGKFRQLARAGG